jgi:hypothetical protein
MMTVPPISGTFERNITVWHKKQSVEFGVCMGQGGGLRGDMLAAMGRI